MANTSSEVQLKPLMDYIDGEFIRPEIHRGIWLENPNTGERAQEQLAASDASIGRAIAAADQVHQAGTWANTPIEERAQMLEAVGAELQKLNPDIADYESYTTGVVKRMTGMLGFIVAGAWGLAANMLRNGALYRELPGPNNHTAEIHSKPWGPALCLVPWNAPAALAAHKVSNALAAGCPTILKPTEWAPNGCNAIAEAIHRAGLPKGVFQLVHGGPDVGAKLVGDTRIRAVSFTGGLQGGRAIAAECAKDFKPAQLELGGNNPVVIMEDADFDEAAQGVMMLMTQLNGQWCRALGRLIVHENIADKFVDHVFGLLAQVKLGDSVSMASDMGPMIHSGHLAKIKGQMQEWLDKGGVARSSTPLPGLSGNFFAPTLVLGCSPADTQHEIFGPIGAVHTYKTDAEAVALANGTPYGLEGYVFGKDEARAMKVGRQIRCGEVKINGGTVISLNLMAPRPSWGWSGFAEEGTLETLKFFCGTRVVGIEGPMKFG